MERFFNTTVNQQEVSKEEVKSFFASVYSYMFLGLMVTGMVSWYLASSGLFLEWFVNPATGGMSPLFYVVVFSPLAFVFLIQAKYQSFSTSTLIALFVVFSMLMGASLSSIFFVYTMSNIATTFFVTAGGFGAMAILGYTTSIDLLKMGSLLYMAFIGIFLAGIVNMFMQSEAMGYWISFIGVFVFTGLTAWEMQKLKAIAHEASVLPEEKKKMSILGGLTLYILFVNLFLSLLRLLGSRD